MPKKKTISIPSIQDGVQMRFLGIDRRIRQTDADLNTFYTATNVNITIGGRIERRDGLKKHAIVPQGTIGLYSIAGKLRVAGPSGNSLSLQMPPNISLDEFGDSNTDVTPLTRYTRVSDYTDWDAAPTTGAQPYLVLETTSGQYIHHWINKIPDNPTDAVATLIQLGFDSGADIEKLQGKLWSANKFSGTVHHSSTVFGPAVWDETIAPDDAGFISPLEHASSDPLITGLKVHQGKLLVVYDDAIQVWKVDPDPKLNQYLTSYDGPGTKVFESFRTVIGDVFYFSLGGFRSLATQTVTGELREGDIGTTIQELTNDFRKAVNGDVRALWSQARSQYICIFNDTDTGTSTAFVYTHVPTFGISGWTQWELPLIAEYIVEHDENLYIRSGNTIYQFDPTYEWDDVGDVPLDVTGTIVIQFVTAGARRRPKQWLALDIVQEGSCDITLLPDPRDRNIEMPIAFNIDGSTQDMGSIPINAFAYSIAIRLEAKLPWEFGALDINVSVLDGGV